MIFRLKFMILISLGLKILLFRMLFALYVVLLFSFLKVLILAGASSIPRPVWRVVTTADGRLPGLAEFGFEHNGRPGSFGKGESLGPLPVAVFGFHFFQGACIQCSGGAGLDADGHFIFNPPVQTETAFSHPGAGLRSELGGIVGAGLQALDVALFVAQAGLAVDDDDPVFLPL